MGIHDEMGSQLDTVSVPVLSSGKERHYSSENNGLEIEPQCAPHCEAEHHPGFEERWVRRMGEGQGARVAFSADHKEPRSGDCMKKSLLPQRQGLMGFSVLKGPTVLKVGQYLEKVPKRSCLSLQNSHCRRKYGAFMERTKKG